MKFCWSNFSKNFRQKHSKILSTIIAQLFFAPAGIGYIAWGRSNYDVYLYYYTTTSSGLDLTASSRLQALSTSEPMPAAPGVPKWSPILSLPNAAWLQFSNGKWCIHQSTTIDAKLINSKLRFYLKLCNLPTNSTELQVYSKAKLFPSGLKAILRHCTNEMRWLVSISQMGTKYAAVLLSKPKAYN